MIPMDCNSYWDISSRRYSRSRIYQSVNSLKEMHPFLHSSFLGFFLCWNCFISSFNLAMSLSDHLPDLEAMLIRFIQCWYSLLESMSTWCANDPTRLEMLVFLAIVLHASLHRSNVRFGEKNPFPHSLHLTKHRCCFANLAR